MGGRRTMQKLLELDPEIKSSSQAVMAMIL
jgi:hypothetical protein